MLSTYELIQNTERDYPTMKKDFLSILDLTTADLKRCLDVAAELKRGRAEGRGAPTAGLLAGQYVALLFDKPSLRTRATFEIAVRELGGQVIDPHVDETLGKREAVADVASKSPEEFSLIHAGKDDVRQSPGTSFVGAMEEQVEIR